MIYIVSLNGVIVADYQNALTALTYSMCFRGSFELHVEGIHFWSIDTVVINGRLYAAPPPGTALAIAPLACLGFLLDGGYKVWGWGSYLSEVAVALYAAAAVAVLYKLLRLWFGELVSIIASLGFAFGSILWPYAAILFPQSITAFLLVTHVYLTIRWVKGLGSYRDLLLAGLAAALMITVDYVSSVAVAITLVYLFLRVRGNLLKKLQGVAPLLTSFLGIAFILYYNSVTTGSPFQSVEGVRAAELGIIAPGDPIWVAFKTPIYLGLLNNLLGTYKGLFIVAPITAAGFVGLLHIVLRKYFDRLTSLYLLGVFFVPVAVYSMWFDWEGGLSYGPRFLVPYSSMLFIGLAYVLNELRGSISALLMYVAHVLGTIYSGTAALTNPLSCKLRPPIINQFLACNLPKLIEGDTTSNAIASSIPENPTLRAATMIAIIVLAALMSAPLYAELIKVKVRNS
jgi:hypothetical protein